MMYCAFLRGVNVNGRNMKMDEVCGIFRRAGMDRVSSVLATGNIIFQSDMAASELCGLLETEMANHFQMESKIFIKSREDLKAICGAVPFVPDPDWHIYAFICDPGFEHVLKEEFQTALSGNQAEESAAINGGYFFWRVRKGGTLNTPFSKILGNRKFKERFTSRNIATIEKVYNKMR